MPEMDDSSKMLDKDTLADIVTKAVSNFYDEQQAKEGLIEEPEDGLVDEKPPVDDTLAPEIGDKGDVAPEEVAKIDDAIDAEAPEGLPEDNKDTEVQEKVEEKVADEVDESGKFNFLGVDIDIKKNDDGKYDVTIKKDDQEKTETIDKVDLDTIFGLIDNFFTDMVVEEDTEPEAEKEDEAEEKEDKEKDKKEDKEEKEESQDEEEKEEESDEKDEDEDPDDDGDSEKDDKDNDEELEEVENKTGMDLDNDNEEGEGKKHSDLIKGKMVSMESLRRQYSDKVNEIFEQGLEAKAIALDMVKDTILANTVKELIQKTKDKDVVIASKQKDLTDATAKYIFAKKYNDQLTKVYTLISSSIKGIESDLSKGLISQELAVKALNKYGVIASKVVSAKKIETLIAGVQQVKKTNTALVAYKKTLSDKKVIVSSAKPAETANKTQDVAKKQLKNVSIKKSPVISKKNVLNSEGWKGNRTLLSNTYTNNIDEMTAEITRIAGIK